MASDFLGTYDPKQVSLNISGLDMSGFGEGTFVTIARIDKETYKTKVGAHGEVARVKNNNKATKITFMLKQTSPSNVTLDLLKNNPVAFPVLVKNNSTGKMMAVADSAWISEEPDEEFADDESNIEWVITCSSLNKSHLPE